MPAFYSDRNGDNGYLQKKPFWHATFDYYLLDATGRSFDVVSNRPNIRTDSANRKVLDTFGFSYSNTTVSKVARQGAFDNFHIAPRMSFKTATATLPVSMAPVCLH